MRYFVKFFTMLVKKEGERFHSLLVLGVGGMKGMFLDVLGLQDMLRNLCT